MKYSPELRDPYTYPGTDLLRNLPNIRDPETLRRFEGIATSKRLLELERQPLRGAFDTKHLQGIHRHIFQDVYAWAGEFRTVDIAKPGQAYFAFKPQIGPSLNSLSADLKREDFLAHVPPDQFVGRLAHYLGEINAIHPYRDGNGRTQREFIRELALQNGLTIDWNRVQAAEIHEASRQSFHGDNKALESVLSVSLVQDTDKARAIVQKSRGPRDRGADRDYDLG